MIAMSLQAQNLRDRLLAIAKWLVTPALAIGLILAVVQCSIARESARIAAAQTYNMGRVAAFRDSGALLDRKVAAFNDAAAEGHDLASYRDAVRDALADHASKTMAMRDAFGEQPTNAYNADLLSLQDQIEATNGPSNSGPVLTALSRVIISRNKLADSATKKASA